MKRILGIYGSPRKKGNTDRLLDRAMEGAESAGARAVRVYARDLTLCGCLECGGCDKTGKCVVEDDMQAVYPLLEEAGVILLAAPIFFYGVPAQAKALIDRSQALWVRRYILNLNDPKRKVRRGFLLALGATKGKNLFEGVSLTAKYFFDAIGSGFNGSLTYRRIEKPGDMEKHATVLREVKEEVGKLVTPVRNRKKILFICRENACRSQMAGAFAEYLAGEKIEAVSGGSDPASEINPVMIEAMEEKGIDTAFRKPKSIETAMEHTKPDMIITMGCGDACPFVPGAETQDWDLPDPSDKSIEFMRNVRDEIEKRVLKLTRISVITQESE